MENVCNRISDYKLVYFKDSAGDSETILNNGTAGNLSQKIVDENATDICEYYGYNEISSLKECKHAINQLIDTKHPFLEPNAVQRNISQLTYTESSDDTTEVFNDEWFKSNFDRGLYGGDLKVKSMKDLLSNDVTDSSSQLNGYYGCVFDQNYISENRPDKMYPYVNNSSNKLEWFGDSGSTNKNGWRLCKNTNPDLTIVVTNTCDSDTADYDSYLNDFNNVTLEIDGSPASTVINMPTFREMVGLDSTDNLSDAGTPNSPSIWTPPTDYKFIRYPKGLENGKFIETTYQTNYDVGENHKIVTYNTDNIPVIFNIITEKRENINTDTVTSNDPASQPMKM